MVCEGVSGASSNYKGYVKEYYALQEFQRTGKIPKGYHMDDSGNLVANKSQGKNTASKTKKSNTAQKSSATQSHGAGAKGPSVWNPTAEAQRRGDFAPHQR